MLSKLSCRGRSGWIPDLLDYSQVGCLADPVDSLSARTSESDRPGVSPAPGAQALDDAAPWPLHCPVSPSARNAWLSLMSVCPRISLYCIMDMPFLELVF